MPRLHLLETPSSKLNNEFDRLATLLFYLRTFWSAFKVLKVPKRRRKVQPPTLNAPPPTLSEPLQTPPSSHPLTQAQRVRRTKIKETTQLCLVWVIWTHSKRFLDWISWVIPFYDEMNLAFLIWLILMGPSAADIVFKHTIHRLITPYEHSFDSVLGTTHDVLQITIYLLTSGPKHLSLKWKKWQARQFNKSLLSVPTVVPPVPPQLHAPPPFHSQPAKTRCENSFASASHSSHTALTGASSSTYLVVPDRKPALSRKLSDGYKRSVSSNRPKGLLGNTALYNARSTSTNRTIYPFRSGSTSALLATDLNYSRITKSPAHSQAHASKENIHPSNPDLKENQSQDDDNTSIIIHDNSLHEMDVIPTKSKLDMPVKTSRPKRVRNANDDDDAIAFRKAKKALRDTSSKRNFSKAKKEQLKAPDSTRTNHLEGQPTSQTNSQLHALPAKSCAEDLQAPTCSWQTCSSAAYPTMDLLLSHSPKMQRRLHKPDDPLPLPSLQTPHYGSFNMLDTLPDEQEEIAEKALISVQSSTSTGDFQDPTYLDGWLAHQRPTLISGDRTRSTSAEIRKTPARKGLSRSLDNSIVTKKQLMHHLVYSDHLKTSTKSPKKMRENWHQNGLEKKRFLAAKVLDPNRHPQVDFNPSPILKDEPM